MTATLIGLAAGVAVVCAAVAAAPPVPARLPAERGSPVVARRRSPEWVREAGRQLGAPVDPELAWACLRATPAVIGALTLTVAGPVAAVVLALGCLAVPRLVRPMLRRRRAAERDSQLPATFERLASALRAGSLLGPALVDVARSTAGPLGDELRGVGASLERGEALTGALDRWARRPDTSPDVALAAAALGLGAQAGGQVARAVDGVAATLRERRELQAEVRALATQARSSAWLLAAAPLAFAALVATVEPGVLTFLVTTPIGLGCLVAGLTLDAIGVRWMARIVRRAT